MITLHDLIEWRRRELAEPPMVHPPPPQDLEKYIQGVMAEAGHPATWDPECEAFAAMDQIQEIFRIRRSKLTWACETNCTIEPNRLFRFEIIAWDEFQQTYQRLDKAIEEISIKGTWSENPKTQPSITKESGDAP
jgi:hypothetical protein